MGTNRADVLKGTAKRDVIVAKGGADIIVGLGGNDIICAGPGNDRVAGQAGHDRIAGQAGADRLFGGGGVDRLMGNAGTDFLAGQAGPDILAGGVGNDRFDGGIGVDTCHQGSGSGLKVRCERPAQMVAPLPPPTLHDVSGLLAIAYSDIDGLDGYSSGDVLIAKLVDNDGDHVPSSDDTIEMGRYPKDYAAATFGDWAVTTHGGVAENFSDYLSWQVTSDHGVHRWYHNTDTSTGHSEMYYEEAPSGLSATFYDRLTSTADDRLATVPLSPSQPDSKTFRKDPRPGDDPFIDVEVFYK